MTTFHTQVIISVLIMPLSSNRNDSGQKHTTSSGSAKKSSRGEGDSSIFLRKCSKKDGTVLYSYIECHQILLVTYMCLADVIVGVAKCMWQGILVHPNVSKCTCHWLLRPIEWWGEGVYRIRKWIHHSFSGFRVHSNTILSFVLRLTVTADFGIVYQFALKY